MRALFQRSNRKRLIALLALIGWLILLVFSGNLRAQGGSGQDAPIKIGLLIPAESYVEASYGARYAVEQFNAKGGVNGTGIELLIRHMEGPWGQGTKEVVDLVYNEEVVAILGAHRGRNAHLVEQVIAKTQVPFISAWASDPTLSQAFVPWYFSCVPNSRSQAEAFDKELLDKKGHRKLLLLSDGTYDAELDRNHLLTRLKTKGFKEVDVLDFDPKKIQESEFPSKNFDGIVLFGEPATAVGIFEVLKEKYGNVPVYGSFSMLGEGFFSHFGPESLKNFSALGSGDWPVEVDDSWHKRFVEEFGRYPGATAAYAFDGMQLLLTAIKEAKGDRSAILRNIAATNYRGLTGMISFDARGNRNGIPELLSF